MINQVSRRSLIYMYIYERQYEKINNICKENVELYMYAFKHYLFVSNVSMIDVFNTVPKNMYNDLLALSLCNNCNANNCIIMNEILHKYRADIDLDIIFDKYLDIYYVKYFLHPIPLEEVCAYMYKNKVDMDRYVSRILILFIKNCMKIPEYLHLTQEQRELYDRFENCDRHSFEYVVLNSKHDTYTSLYALTKCQYNDDVLDVEIINAYEDDDIVKVNKTPHIPNYKCLQSVIRYYVPTEDMNTTPRLYELKIHTLPNSDKIYRLEDEICINETFQLLLGVKKVRYTNTIRHLYIMFYAMLCTEKEYESCINMEDVIKYCYIQNIGIADIYINIGIYEHGYINFGNFMHYVLDNYL